MKKLIFSISKLCVVAAFIFPTIIFAAETALVVTCPAPKDLNITAPEQDMIYGRGTQAGAGGWISNIMFVFNAGMVTGPAQSQLASCTNQSVDYVNGYVQCTYNCTSQNPGYTFPLNSPWIGQKELQKTIQGANQITLVFQTDLLSKSKK